MNLGFDIDGVISNFTTKFTEIIQRKYGVRLKDTDMYSYDVNLILGVTKDEVADIVTETLKSDLPLNPMSKETLDKLSAEGHNIYLLTARSSALIDYTTRWLSRKSINHNGLFHMKTGEKYMADVSVDVVVEDNLEEALELTKKVKLVLLYDQPWNRTKNVKGLLKRVHSWSEIYEEVHKIAAVQSGNPDETSSK
jgi:uncharacterized HAD superfamily protein